MSTPNPQQAVSVQERVVRFMQGADPLLKEAASIVETKQAADAQIAEMIPNIVETLVANRRIWPDQRKQAEAILHDPVKALELLKSVAEHRVPGEADKLGQAEGGEKTASANENGGVTPSVTVGLRPGMSHAATAAMCAKLGISVPVGA